MLNAFNDVTFLSEDQKSSRSGKERNRCAINEGEGIFEDFFGGQFGEFFSPFSLDLPLLSAFGTVWRCFPL